MQHKAYVLILHIGSRGRENTIPYATLVLALSPSLLLHCFPFHLPLDLSIDLGTAPFGT